MDKRYQVFVSSTYEDLIEERQEVMHALLELDCIPSGMELFPAADEDQWSLIRRVIDDCDYYLVIIAGRYGSTDSTGRSYTQLEYEYAISRGKPVIAFLHKDPDSLPGTKIEKSETAQKKLQEFRSLVQKRMCKYWTTPAELGSVVSRSLIKLIKTNPAIGWVRADLLPTESMTQENIKLRKKIEELEKELEEARTEAPAGTEDLAQGTDKFEINFSYVCGHTTSCMLIEDPFGEKDQTHYGKMTSTWNEIFSMLSPSMINEATESQLKNALNSFIKSQTEEKLQKKHPGKVIRSFSVNNEDFNTIKVQLRALGLIAPSVKKRGVRDTATYFKLTPYGDNVMMKLRAIKKNQ